MGFNCVVNMCQSHRKNDTTFPPYIHFFKIPTDEQRLKKWKQAFINLNDQPLIITKCSKICSEHFEPECVKRDFGHISLKRDSIPSKFPQIEFVEFLEYESPEENTNDTITVSSESEENDDINKPSIEKSDNILCKVTQRKTNLGISELKKELNNLKAQNKRQKKRISNLKKTLHLSFQRNVKLKIYMIKMMNKFNGNLRYYKSCK